MEEARANGAEGIDDEMINGIRAGLMGPLAGIGDSLIVGTYIPILLGIALGFAEGGSPLGPFILYHRMELQLQFGSKIRILQGYELGGSAVELLVGQKATAFRESLVTWKDKFMVKLRWQLLGYQFQLTVIAQSYDAGW